MPKKKNTIFAEERRLAVMDMIKEKGKVTVEELCRTFNVTSATVRTDLTELEKLKLVRRTHGGAIAYTAQAKYEQTTAEKEDSNVRQKQAIAKEAVRLIEAGDVVALDTGTTIQELAKQMENVRGITVVTNDIAIAAILDANPNITVVLLGGTLRQGLHCTVGPTAMEQLENLYVDKAFLAANGVSARRGLSTPNTDNAEIKKRMIRNSGRAIALMDSSKLKTEAFCKFADIKDFDMLIMDEGVPKAFAEAVKKAGVEMIIAKEE